MKKIILAIFILTVFIQNANARIGIRSLGMGGAFVSVANDPSTAYWNPAGLIQVPDSKLYFGTAIDNRRRQEFNYDNQIYLSSTDTYIGKSSKYIMVLSPILLVGLFSSQEEDEYESQRFESNNYLTQSSYALLKSDWGHDDRIPKRPEKDKDDDEEEEDNDDEKDNDHDSDADGCGCMDIFFDILFTGLFDSDEDDEEDKLSDTSDGETEKVEDKPVLPRAHITFEEEEKKEPSEPSDFHESIGGYIFTNEDKFTIIHTSHSNNGMNFDKIEQKYLWVNLSGAWGWRKPDYTISLGLNYRLYLMNQKIREFTPMSDQYYDDNGVGFSVDISALYLTRYFRTGILFQDLLSTGIVFNLNQDDEWELNIIRNVQPGFAFTPFPGTIISFDIYDVFADGGEENRAYCFGFEQEFSDFFAVRTGSYKKNLTCGCSVNVSDDITIDYAYLSDKTLHFDSEGNSFELLDKKDFANNTHLIGISITW